MAKPVKPKTGGIIIDGSEIIEENTAAEIKTEGDENSVADNVTSEVIANSDIVQKSAVKTFRILPAVNHTCSIGGIRYTLKKGVCQNVPEEVKTILNKSGLLLPL